MVLFVLGINVGISVLDVEVFVFYYGTLKVWILVGDSVATTHGGTGARVGSWFGDLGRTASRRCDDAFHNHCLPSKY